MRIIDTILALDYVKQFGKGIEYPSLKAPTSGSGEWDRYQRQYGGASCLLSVEDLIGVDLLPQQPTGEDDGEDDRLV